MRTSLFAIVFFLFHFCCWGQLEDVQIIEAKNSSWHLLSFDVDGDAYQDVLAFMGSSRPAIAWYEDVDGSGKFKIKRQINIGESYFAPRSPRAVDIDNDGDQDIVGVVNNKVVWLENADGVGKFDSVHEVAGNLSRFAYGDIDGDGDMDIVGKPASWPKHIVWYENLDGSGVFSNEKVIDPDLDLSVKIYTGDIDNDGDEDVLCSTSHELFWYRNKNGLGEFGDKIFIPENVDFITSAGLADLDSDNDLDVVLGRVSGDSSVWLVNDGMGGFDSLKLVAHDLIADDFLAEDFDLDGDVDLVFWGDKGKVVWYENLDGLGTFGEENIANYLGNNSSGYSVRSAILIDADNDNNKEIVWSIDHTTFADLFEIVEYNPSDGVFLDKKIIDDLYQYNNPVSVVDMDGDGDLDLFVKYTGKASWYENTDSDGSFGVEHIIYTTSNGPNSVYPLDFDADGDLDVVTIDKDQNLVYWYENIDGAGTFTDSSKLITELAPYEDVLIADINGDSFPDILATGEAPFADNKITWYENAGGAGLVGEPELLFIDSGAFSLDIELFHVADLNNDGLNDIILFVGGVSKGLLWLENLGSENGFNPPALIVDFDIVPSVPKIFTGDLDADGDVDVFVRNGSSSEWIENVDASEGEWNRHAIAGIDSYGAFAFGDFNSDGYLDFVNNPIGKLTLFENIFGTGVFEKKSIGGNVDNASSGDLNGDGSLDLVILDESWLLWRVNHSVQIISRCFLDLDEDGVFDSLDIGLNNQMVTLEPESDIYWSDEVGQVSYHVSLGEYTLEYFPAPVWTPTTPLVQNVEVLNSGDTIFVDFGVKPDTSLLEVGVSLNSSATRCGFIVPFWLTYENTGTQLLNGYVSVELDTLVAFVNASPAPDSVSSNRYFWNVQDLPPTYSGQINLFLQMPDVSFLGEEIEIEGKMYVEENGSFVVANGTTYSSVINCSYDPNDKLVYPNISGHDNYTLNNDTLEYLIRFQNTGTDTAINVRIEDQLDSNLDWNSFKVVASSHPFEVYLKNGRIVVRFDNIYLPDSTTNELASHGFVKYQIRSLNGLPENTIVKNSARIYFDFNPPVLTNEVANVMVSEYPLIVELKKNPLCHSSADGEISISIASPEPVYYEWSNGMAGSSISGLTGGTYTLVVRNAQGEIVADSIIVLESPEPIELSAVVTPVNGNNADGTATVQVTGGTPPFTYEWNTNPIQTTQTATGLTVGSYHVVVTDANGCTSEAEVVVDKAVQSSEVGFEWIFNVNPNPSSGFVYVEMDLKNREDWVLKVLDSAGKVVNEYKAPKGGSSKADLVIDDLQSGIYHVMLQVGDDIVSRKLVIQK